MVVRDTAATSSEPAPDFAPDQPPDAVQADPLLRQVSVGARPEGTSAVSAERVRVTGRGGEVPPPELLPPPLLLPPPPPPQAARRRAEIANEVRAARCMKWDPGILSNVFRSVDS